MSVGTVKKPRTCFLCEATSAGTAVSFRRRDICDWCDGELARCGAAWCTTGRHKVRQADMAAGKSRCHACERARYQYPSRAAYARAWRAANPEKVAAYAVSEAYRASKRRYARNRYWSDPEQSRAESRRKKAKRKAQIRQYTRARYWRSPERWRAERRRRHQEAKLRVWRGLK